MTDIIDEIDALVDEQLSGFHDRSGYDYNVNQQNCWHCGREWHGLQITTRMEGMRRVRWYDENYRFAEDDSQILCPGSHFIGPWATKSQLAWIRSNNEKTLKLQTDLTLGKVFPGVTVYEPAVEDFSLADQTIPPEMQFPREWPDYASTLRRILEIPNPFDPAAWIMTVGDSDPEPDTRTPQERALPRPSTTPPMWARDVGTQRRTRTNSRRRHR